MNRKTLRTIALRSFALFAAFGIASQAKAGDVKAPYPSMAPLEQYLIADRNSEIALAQSAAPESIARDAEVMVLTQHGYEAAIKGKNGFVCLVMRSWIAPSDDPEFWEPKGRAPACFNPAAVRSYLPRIIKKTEWALAGRSKAQIFDALKAASDSKELPAMASGAMCYMLSKQTYSIRDGHWHPHLMFFFSGNDPKAWGANLRGSPIYAFNDLQEGLTAFLIPVGHWSDGTADSIEH